jgi:hypothetical protein
MVGTISVILLNFEGNLNKNESDEEVVLTHITKVVSSSLSISDSCVTVNDDRQIVTDI